MWKILNKLLGFDYIMWNNSCSGGVARVHAGGSGRPWYYRYKITDVIDKIRDEKQVIWLTCDPDKYLNPEEYLSKDKKVITEKLVGPKVAVAIFILFSIYYIIYTF